MLQVGAVAGVLAAETPMAEQRKAVLGWSDGNTSPRLPKPLALSRCCMLRKSRSFHHDTVAGTESRCWSLSRKCQGGISNRPHLRSARPSEGSRVSGSGRGRPRMPHLSLVCSERWKQNNDAADQTSFFAAFAALPVQQSSVLAERRNSRDRRRSRELLWQESSSSDDVSACSKDD